jgi:peptidoglycan/xylan/chitin deacetylase (PgdA/CDA1 family)
MLNIHWLILLNILTGILCWFLKDILNPWIWLLPAGFSLLLTVVGSANIRSGFHLKALCRLSGSGKRIALTFDDGPHPTQTPLILDMLDRYNARATFFCIGKNVDASPELAAEIIRRGHSIGAHSYQHGFYYDLQNTNQLVEDSKEAIRSIYRATGVNTLLFRPPYGVTTPSIARMVKKLQLKTVGWSIRSYDTMTNQPEKIENRVLSRIKPGAIILLHDHSPSVLPVLEKILDFCTRNGYITVTITETTV